MPLVGSAELRRGPIVVHRAGLALKWHALTARVAVARLLLNLDTVVVELYFECVQRGHADCVLILATGDHRARMTVPGFGIAYVQALVARL